MHEKEIILHSTLKKRVRDGISTRFWHDVWINDLPLKVKFPRLFHLEVNKGCWVRDRWMDGWNWNWNRDINGGVTFTQLIELNQMLVDVQLSENKDEWCWNLIDVNHFTIKDTRNYILIIWVSRMQILKQGGIKLFLLR